MMDYYSWANHPPSSQFFDTDMLSVSDMHNGRIVRFIVFHATFNTISVISWRSVLLVEEIGGRRKRLTCRKSPTNSIT